MGDGISKWAGTDNVWPGSNQFRGGRGRNLKFKPCKIEKSLQVTSSTRGGG